MTPTKGTEPRSEPSPGALRAAEKIAEIPDDTPHLVSRFAEIIDYEAGASDLLAALELIAKLSNLDAALRDVTTRDQNLKTIWATARNAILKEKG